jgi:2-C-methyl-D-erythritol 4-phosphate cytidylyltransferase/2-C-methyl-D-erythritol 2,4-cyclodiphosphate synthase
MNDSERFALVMVAAGRGERAGAPHNGPKQYRLIGGKSVITWTLSRFLAHPACGDIVVVIHSDDQDLFAKATAGVEGLERVRTVIGGASRQASVRAGLKALAISVPRHVLIHDAVRPFVSDQVIDGVVKALAADSRQHCLPSRWLTRSNVATPPALSLTLCHVPVCSERKLRKVSTTVPF